MAPVEETNRIPRLTRRVFWDLAIFMVGLGLLTGLIFPPFVVLLGMPSAAAFSVRFVLACVSAGLLVGGLNHRLAREIVGRRLRLLSRRLGYVEEMIREATLTGDWSRCTPEACRVPVDSDDELGETAASFNALLEALDREERFRALVQKSLDLITVVDPDGTIRYQSPSIERMLGHSPADLVGTRVQHLLHADDVPRMISYLADLAAGEERGATAVGGRMRHRDGTWCHMEIVGANLLAEANVRGLLLTSRDVGERKHLEEQLRHQAFHDPLTGLANRVLFHDRVAHALARGGRRDEGVGLLVLDIDNFKTINDSLGHTAGDDLLVAVAERLQQSLRASDTPARLGGDEFAVLLEDLRDPTESVPIGNRILEGLEAPFVLQGRQVSARASIGIAVAGPGDALTQEELLRNADVAMYAAKREGKGRQVFFHAGMHAEALERLELEADLRRGLESGDFVLEYQPVVAFKTGRTRGVEALVRWNHPRRGRLPPGQFIPLAEETGLIVPLGQWVLREACRQAAIWQAAYRWHPPLSVSVNISPRQLRQPNLVDDVASALAESGLDSASLVLEITENVLIEDTEGTIETLHRLKALGVSLAIDDFGTGYSSLSYLSRLPVDVLKIDRAFVAKVVGDSEESAVAQAILKLAATFRLSTVAEGVELAEQAGRLRDLGGHLGQGFYFAPPLPVEDLEALLSRERSAPEEERWPRERTSTLSPQARP